jgi:hypothetical protein
LRIVVWSTCILSAVSQLHAQPGNAAPQNFQNPNVGLGFGQGNNVGVNGAGPQSAPGGGANADFDSLIDLIQSTVAVDTWAENGGGEAEIRPFPTGVLVDAAGTLQLLKVSAPSVELTERRLAGRVRVGGHAAAVSVGGHAESIPHRAAADPRQVGADPALRPALTTADPRRASALRFVSLPRLEQEIIRRQDAHQPLDEAMLTLAGLQRVLFVFVYPESGDLLLAGPAGDWQVDAAACIVSRDSGAPVVRLDDLLTLLRRAKQAPDSIFGCAINPRQEALARTQALLDTSAARPLEPRRRDAWLAQLRDTLGRQEVDIFGIDPASRVARVLVEADVHMKLIGMGLEDGVPGVGSYLDSVVAAARQNAAAIARPSWPGAGGQPAAMSVLRWWFTLRYESIRTTAAGDAFELVGPGAGVLCENELLAAQGRRVHTGQSDPLNQKFADSFTAHFAALADKYPVYGELRNIFDLALVVALIHADDLFDRAGWQPTRLVDAERLRLPQWPVPREVDTVANYREVNRRQLVAGVSGGVMIATEDVLAKPRETVEPSKLPSHRQNLPPADADSANWWWDAEPTH